MERTIITRQTVRKLPVGPVSDAPLPGKPLERPTDSYQAQFLKLIPVEVISAYITIDGLLKGSILPKDDPNLYKGLLWGVFVILAVLNPLYLRYVSKVKDQRQIGLSAGAFVIYVVSLGGPFLFLGLDEPVVHLLGSILIPIYMLVALIVLNK